MRRAALLHLWVGLMLSPGASLAQPFPEPVVTSPAPTSQPASSPATTPPPTPSAVAAEPTSPPPAGVGRAEPLPWRGTRLVWSQSLTTQTVGIGSDRQTLNPTWEHGYTVRPRYYLYGDGEQVLSVRAEVGVFRELTNSDTTTRRGEWSLTDALLYAAYARLLFESGMVGPAPATPDAILLSTAPEYLTALVLHLPRLTLPTSTVSRHNGTRVGLGALIGLAQSVPVLGLESAVLPAADFEVVLGYQHLFTEATEPTASDLNRVRLTPDGASVPGDQLGAVPFAAHQLTVSLGGTLYLARRVSLTSTLGWRPSWKYTFDEDQEICGVVDTGCTVIGTTHDRRGYAVVTEFSAGVGVRPLRAVGVGLGYTNVSLQLGPDGMRRNLLYSPDARFELVVTMHLDEVFRAVTGRTRRARESLVASRASLR